MTSLFSFRNIARGMVISIVTVVVTLSIAVSTAYAEENFPQRLFMSTRVNPESISSNGMFTVTSVISNSSEYFVSSPFNINSHTNSLGYTPVDTIKPCTVENAPWDGYVVTVYENEVGITSLVISPTDSITVNCRYIAKGVGVYNFQTAVQDMPNFPSPINAVSVTIIVNTITVSGGPDLVSLSGDSSFTIWAYGWGSVHEYQFNPSGSLFTCYPGWCVPNMMTPVLESFWVHNSSEKVVFSGSIAGWHLVNNYQVTMNLIVDQAWVRDDPLLPAPKNIGVVFGSSDWNTLVITTTEAISLTHYKIYESPWTEQISGTQTFPLTGTEYVMVSPINSTDQLSITDNSPDFFQPSPIIIARNTPPTLYMFSDFPWAQSKTVTLIVRLTSFPGEIGSDYKIIISDSKTGVVYDIVPSFWGAQVVNFTVPSTLSGGWNILKISRNGRLSPEYAVKITYRSFIPDTRSDNDVVIVPVLP